MIWFGFVAGPVAWAGRELVSYALVRPSCGIGSTQWLLLTAAAMLGLSVSGALAGRVCLVRSRGARDDGSRSVDRDRFMGTVVVGLNLLMALLIILSAVSDLTLNPCE